MILIVPNSKYQESFLTALKEYKPESNKKKKIHQKIEENFSGYLKIIESRRESKIYIWWLVDKGKYLGRITLRKRSGSAGDVSYNIRPSKRNMGYGSLILKLALEKIRGMGRNSIILVCRKSNVASKKIIEKNGGEFFGCQRRKNKEERLKYRIIL